jgi:hypothetical protein
MIVILALVFQLFSPKMDPSVYFGFSTPDVKSVKATTENASTTDISGHWEGTITRDEGGGKRTVFKMELDLMQKGKDVTGTSYVHAEGEKRIYSANMSLAGRVNKTYFKYEELKILNYDPIPDAEWCVKKCELRYKLEKGTTPTLEGIWEGTAGSTGGCIPGRIFLQKKPARV